MNQNRREFLTGTAWMGVAAMAAGCMSKGSAVCGIGGGTGGAPMHGFRVAPMKKVRVGVIGVGDRGTPAVHRIAQIPGCEVTAISDINPVRLDAIQSWMKEHGYPAAASAPLPDKRLCHGSRQARTPRGARRVLS